MGSERRKEREKEKKRKEKDLGNMLKL